MDLVPYIYWEKQEPGSQLCAQHCLNSILQQFTYTEFDLAEIAQNLDQAENATLEPSNQNKKSFNLDDTGFFSVSVLERALQVWDLTLVRWRGEAMKPFQEHPEDEAAFILHLASHWLPLRRFSPHHPTKSSTSNRWYNLNSFLPNGPEWISATYLRLVLTQAEKEGYSVFVIRKAGHSSGGTDEDNIEGVGWGDGGIGVLPDSEADRMAFVLGEPVGRSGGAGSSSFTAGPSGTTNPDLPTVDTSTSPPAGSSSSRPVLSSPLAGSGRRRRRQGDLTPTDLNIAHPPNPSTQSPQADIFDDASFANPAHAAAGDEINNLEDDDAEEHLDAGNERDYRQRSRSIPNSGHRGDHLEGDEGYAGPMDFAYQSRSYDDEDAQLQAALKASMADVPEGWVAPTLEPKEKVVKKVSPAPIGNEDVKGQVGAAPEKVNWKRVDEVVPPPATGGASESTSKFVEEIGDEEEEGPTEVLSPEEIRRRRLARFQ